MKSIGGVLLAIVILLAMVTIHEFGHYLAGKILGFKINEFSVGFGPAIFKKRSKKTGELFAVRVIPLGGYCAFDGEDEIDETPNNSKPTQKEETEDAFGEFAPRETEREDVNPPVIERQEIYPEPKGARFNDQPAWKRIIVLIAGATMNYLLALTLILIMFSCLGRPVFQITKLAPDKDFQTETATQVYENGLQTGDVILELNGEKMYLITDYLDALDGKKKGETVQLLVLRDSKKTTITVSLVEDVDVVNMSDSNSIFFPLGIAYRENITLENGSTEWKIINGGSIQTKTARAGFWETIGTSFAYSFKLSGVVLRSLGELFTGKLGMDAVGGPITTISSTAKVASDSLFSFLYIASFIGVNLAVFNLLPIPALDGCKVIFCLIEWIRRKPVNRKVEAIIHFAGIILLFGFAILVDLLHLF